MTRRRAAVLATAVLLASVGPVAAKATPTEAITEPAWAPASTATIFPGVQTRTAGSQCTANFVFYDATDVYIGQAAHCAGTDGNTATNGCTAGVRPVGTPVTVGGASQAGTMVYNSWVAMKAAGETDPNACRFNDFALVKLHADDRAKVNPSVPFWGGPTAPGAGSSFGEQVYSYGNSSLRLGISTLSPKEGYGLGSSGGGWTHGVYTVTPGIPGDSGSAFLDSQGRALGVLSTVQLAPLAGSNGVSDLQLALDYMALHGGPVVELAFGTEAFAPGLLP